MTRHISILSLLLLAACGGGFSSDLPHDQPASALSAAEARLLCEQATAHISAQHDGEAWAAIQCRAEAMVDELFSCPGSPECHDACEAEARSCLDSASLVAPGYTDFVDCSDVSDYLDCPASVDRIETCVEDFAAAVGPWRDELSCTRLESIDMRPFLSPDCRPLIEGSGCAVFFYGD